MRSDIREGGTFPDYELADQSGRRRSLSELQGGNPMVLHLSRGGFDPKEHQFVGQLVDVNPEFRNAYTRLALISTDNQLNINEFRDALGATWPFLSDPDRVVQKDLDIKEFTDEPHDPMINTRSSSSPDSRSSRSTTDTGTGAGPRWQSST